MLYNQYLYQIDGYTYSIFLNVMYSSIIGVQLDQLVVVNPTELSNPMDGETKHVWLFLMINLEMESNGTMSLATTEEF